jgi:LysR family glycine cleavage system transcriptional activator/LysR family transcriptional regulator of beta-lactamase
MKLVEIDRIWAYLPAFLAVAQSQHLRRAAGELHVSPSALSRSISILEHRVGYPLFDRRAGRMRLNAMGERLHFTVRQVFQLVEHAVEDREVTGVHSAAC